MYGFRACLSFLLPILLGEPDAAALAVPIVLLEVAVVGTLLARFFGRSVRSNDRDDRNGVGTTVAPPGAVVERAPPIRASLFSRHVFANKSLEAAYIARAIRNCERSTEYFCMVTARSIHWFPYDRVRVVNADP